MLKSHQNKNKGTVNCRFFTEYRIEAKVSWPAHRVLKVTEATVKNREKDPKEEHFKYLYFSNYEFQEKKKEIL